MEVREMLLNGTCRLCRKLPSTISDEAQRQPKTEAFSQIMFKCRSGFIYNAGFDGAFIKKMEPGCSFGNELHSHFAVCNPS